jgi:hypothetical protein
MATEDERVEVRDPNGSGWIAAKFLEIAEPMHIDEPRADGGRGYEADQYRVIYLEGGRRGTIGLHTISEIRRPSPTSS